MVKKIGDKYINSTFENISILMIMEMNIGLHVNYRKYWNTKIEKISKSNR